jgi:phosphate-selective porin OprO and OprP
MMPNPCAASRMFVVGRPAAVGVPVARLSESGILGDPTRRVGLRNLARLLVAATVFVSLSPSAAQETPFAADRALESRVRELEEAVRRLGEPKAAPVAADSTKSPVLAGWDNGFILRSPDDQFKLRITGQLQSDYRGYLDGGDSADLPTFLVRRARLGIEATVLQYYEFRLLPDFGRGESRIQDAYLNIHYWDEGQFEAGKFKQPFSLEQLIQDRFVPTIERSMIDQLVPSRDVGLMIHGQKLFGDRLDYGISVYDGLRDSDLDTDRNREAAARGVIRPFRNVGLPDWIAAFQLGASVSIGQDEGVLGQAIYRTPANVPWFQFASNVRPDGRRVRFSPEVAYIYGPLSLSAQTYDETRSLRAPAIGKVPAADVDLSARGYYLMATCLLTGEERTSLSQAIDPLSPFDPVNGLHGFGALELVGRVSRLDFDAPTPAEFLRLVDPARTAAWATEVTTGFNWYLNRFVRVQFNWEYAQFGNRVRLGTGPGGRIDHQNSYLTRVQLVF